MVTISSGDRRISSINRGVVLTDDVLWCHILPFWLKSRYWSHYPPCFFFQRKGPLQKTNNNKPTTKNSRYNFSHKWSNLQSSGPGKNSPLNWVNGYFILFVCFLSVLVFFKWSNLGPGLFLSMPMNRPGVREISTGGYGGYGRCDVWGMFFGVKKDLVNFAGKDGENWFSQSGGQLISGFRHVHSGFIGMWCCDAKENLRPAMLMRFFHHQTFNHHRFFRGEITHTGYWKNETIDMYVDFQRLFPFTSAVSELEMTCIFSTAWWPLRRKGGSKSTPSQAGSGQLECRQRLKKQLDFINPKRKLMDMGWNN